MVGKKRVWLSEAPTAPRTRGFYWDQLYFINGHLSLGYPYCHIIRIGQQFFLTAPGRSIPQETDIGPFESLQDAIVAADTAMDLGGLPETWR